MPFKLFGRPCVRSVHGQNLNAMLLVVQQCHYVFYWMAVILNINIFYRSEPVWQTLRLSVRLLWYITGLWHNKSTMQVSCLYWYNYLHDLYVLFVFRCNSTPTPSPTHISLTTSVYSAVGKFGPTLISKCCMTLYSNLSGKIYAFISMLGANLLFALKFSAPIWHKWTVVPKNGTHLAQMDGSFVLPGV